MRRQIGPFVDHLRDRDEGLFRPGTRGDGRRAEPEVSELDDDGYVHDDDIDVAPGLEEGAHAGASACPEMAIHLDA